MKNILGEDFDSEIKSQVDARQKSLGKYSNILPKDLIYYQNKAPWIKLASSVDLTPGGKNANILKNALNLSSDNNIKDSELAKKCILHGGVVSKDNPKPQAGLRFKSDDIFSGAYGWGGGERGFVPQPGIVGADVTYYNDGALSKATVSIKCFSREQFAVIDALYMRPGYGVLLEFGWSMYLDKDSKLKEFDQFNSEPLERFFGKELDDNLEIYKLIKEERLKHEGNYDGVYGKISKFDWKFNNDGSYDITIQITGYGDMIESLTVTPPNYTPIKDDEEGDSSFNIFEIFNSNKKEDNLNTLAKISPLHGGLYEIKTLSDSDNNNKVKKKKVEEDNNKIILYEIDQNEDIIEIISNDSSPNKSSRYISLRRFLELVKTTLLPKSGKKSKPKFDFDILQKGEDDKPKNFFVFSNKSISSDPKKVLVSFNYDVEGLDEKTQANITALNTGTPLNKIKTDNNVRGDLRYIYLNIDEIFKLLVSSTGEEGIAVFDLIYNVLKFINNSLGGINKLTPILDNTEGLIRIIDYSPLMLLDNPPLSGNPPKDETAKFNIFGVSNLQGSFVRNINLSSEISDDLSTMISIGAAANDNEINANSTSFSDYNKGLEDRLGKDTTLPGQETTKEDGKPLTLEEKINKFKNEKKTNFIKNVDLLYGEFDFDNDTINSLSTFNRGFQQLYIRSQQSGDKKISSFFLPFNLQLTMDGLGGMKLFQRFKVNEDQKVLPPMYDGQNIDLIIKGINHSITPTGWTTTLDSLSVPKSTAK